MARSAEIRLADFRAILRIVGECRDLGDSVLQWRSHLAERAAKLVGGDMVLTGEISDPWNSNRTSLGTAAWGWDHGRDTKLFVKALREFSIDPFYDPAMNVCIDRAKADPAVYTRNELLSDDFWYRSGYFELISRSLGIDNQIYAFQRNEITSNVCDGLIVCRFGGRRNFSPRETRIYTELQRTIQPTIGGILATFREPMPDTLPPRVRNVLRCMLEGDGDKQIAARLRLSRYTVNQYTKRIFEHFSVNSRAELLARWIKRGWGSPFAWE